MHKDLCRGVPGLCDAMRPTKGADLLKYLRKVNFTGKQFPYSHSQRTLILVTEITEQQELTFMK